jgi:hypothetical protein
MTAPKGPPRLFTWGRDGIPGEFESYLGSLEVTARMERGENIRGASGGGVQINFARAGVMRLAEELIAQLLVEKEQFRKTKGHPAKLSHRMATLIYMLHCYCAEWKAPAPAALLRLTFEAMDLQEERPAREVEKMLGIPVGIKNMRAFLDAAALDGEADTAGRKIDLLALERAVGVSRQTIRRWRQMKQYKSRRRAVEWSQSQGGHGKV